MHDDTVCALALAFAVKQAQRWECVPFRLV
jgi:hypothetical protein